jgi:hypothetical protein
MKQQQHINSIFAALLCGLLASGHAFAITAAEDLDGELEIRPSAPEASWPGAGQSNELAPNYTATISVTVVESEQDGGVNYTLSSGPDATTGSSDPNVVWTKSGTTFSITNTAADTASATMTLTCVWSPEGGDGGGEGPGPEDIPGQADADVQLLDSVVDWDFDRTRQWADGEKDIEFTVTITDGNGFGLERWELTEFSATEADPSDPAWAFFPVASNGPAWIMTSTVLTYTPSKGKVKIEYDDGSDEERTSTEEIAFIEIKLVKVGFEGAGNRPIKSDDGGTDYTAPHWNDPDGDGDPSDGHAHPVAYVSDTKLTIKPEWKLEPEVDDVDLKIKASGPDSVAIDEVNAQVTGDKVDLASGAEATDEFEKDKVRYWEEFALGFEASFQGEDEWVEVGTSKNQLYVTHSTPTVSPLFHTVIHLGCSNADGIESPGDIVAAIWGEFNDRDVRRVHSSAPMQYWGPNASGNADTASLLAAGDGQCGAWARFLRDVIKAQGIQGAEARQVLPKPPQDSVLQRNALWVKNQDLSPLSASPPGPPTPLQGIAGQGLSNPSQSVFKDHGVTVYGGTVYDPSYGVAFGSLVEWQRDSLDAVSFRDPQGNIVFSTNSGATWPQLVEYGQVDP